MEASCPVDGVTRFAATNKRTVYMEPSYSAFICLTHCNSSCLGVIPPFSAGYSAIRVTRLRHVNMSRET